MSEGEMMIETVRRHVREGERHVTRQREIVEDFRKRGYPTAAAEQLLFTFEDSLGEHRQHLARLLREHRGKGEPDRN